MADKNYDILLQNLSALNRHDHWGLFTERLGGVVPFDEKQSYSLVTPNVCHTFPNISHVAKIMFGKQ